MRNYTSVKDLGNLNEAVKEALEIKKNRFAYKNLGENKTLLMVFFNSSLRTRLSTQKAGMNLGMNTMVLDVNQGAWKLETERGVIMDGDKSEHLLEAIPVMGSYCDIIGVRSFANFESKKFDYEETIDQPVYQIRQAARFSAWSPPPVIRFRHSPTLLPSRNIRKQQSPKSCLVGLRTPRLCLRLYPTVSPTL